MSKNKKYKQNNLKQNENETKNNLKQNNKEDEIEKILKQIGAKYKKITFSHDSDNNDGENELMKDFNNYKNEFKIYQKLKSKEALKRRMAYINLIWYLLGYHYSVWYFLIQLLKYVGTGIAFLIFSAILFFLPYQMFKFASYICFVIGLISTVLGLLFLLPSLHIYFKQLKRAYSTSIKPINLEKLVKKAKKLAMQKAKVRQ